MGILDSLQGFEKFAGSVNIRQFSKTRKIRKSEDSLFYSSKKEVIITSEMVSVRPLSPEIEEKLSLLNKLFLKVDDSLLKRIYLLEYDILVEKTVGEIDRDDLVIIHSMQKELLDCISMKGINIGELEKMCLSTNKE